MLLLTSSRAPSPQMPAAACCTGCGCDWEMSHLLHILLGEALLPPLLACPHHVLHNGLCAAGLCRRPPWKRAACQSALLLLAMRYLGCCDGHRESR